MDSSRAMSTLLTATTSVNSLPGVSFLVEGLVFFAPPPFFFAKTLAGSLSSGVSFVKNNLAALSETVPPHLRPSRASSDFNSSPLTAFSRSAEVANLLKSIPIPASLPFADCSPPSTFLDSNTMEASACRHSQPDTPPFAAHSFSNDAIAGAITSDDTFKNGDVRLRNPVRYFSNSRKNRAYLRRSRNLPASGMEVLSPFDRIDRKSR
mmetsp:Transcript_12991/g.19422  ORF Transcript_12991/g.19422 Transcript_12991/m.19422 type:complete len:208 (-) Transcript_12991:204-827(-)